MTTSVEVPPFHLEVIVDGRGHLLTRVVLHEPHDPGRWWAHLHTFGPDAPAAPLPAAFAPVFVPLIPPVDALTQMAEKGLEFGPKIFEPMHIPLPNDLLPRWSRFSTAIAAIVVAMVGLWMKIFTDYLSAGHTILLLGAIPAAFILGQMNIATKVSWQATRRSRAAEPASRPVPLPPSA